MDKVNEIKKEISKVVGETEKDVLKDIAYGLKTQLDLLKLLVEKFNGLALRQDKDKALEAILQAIKQLNLSLPDNLQVEVKNFPKQLPVKEYPTTIQISNLKEIANYIKIPEPRIIVKQAKEVKVKNLDEIKIPKSVEIKKPDWWKTINKKELFDVLVESARQNNKGDGMKVDLERYRDAKKSIAVRLSNGKEFYEALAETIVSSGNGIDDQYPAGTGSNGSVTLTNANTAYSVPATAPTGKYVLVLDNQSDTDIYWGFENSSSNGLLLEVGEQRGIPLGANQSVYCYSATAGTVINYSYKKIV